jgi:hypothetical protein
MQHDTIAQTLYSGRCGANNAPYFNYALAQARADVFFVLLFGGRISYSAASFFDSPIAIRIFGELFGDPRFSEICSRNDWLPLRLNTDNPRPWASALDYVLWRWRETAPKLNLFRENESGFDSPSPEETVALKSLMAEQLGAGQYARMQNTYQPFLAPHRLCVATGDTEVACILNEEFADWLHSILDYLQTPGCFVSMNEQDYTTKLSTFAPLAAVKRRAGNLPYEQLANFDRAEFQDCIESFEGVVGNSPLMNEFHTHGMRIFGSYFLLVNSWIEAEWHVTRHAAYSSSTCLLSSNWEERSVFDFDQKSRVHYMIDAFIDDSLQKTQERFGELDWTILLEMVSDTQWQRLIWKVRDARSSEEVDEAGLKILDLLAKRITSFTFDTKGGRVSISAKHLGKAMDSVSTAAVCLEAVETTLHGLLGTPSFGKMLHIPSVDGAVAAVAEIGKSVKAMGAIMIPGVRYAHGLHTGRQLRTAVVPRIYI